MFKAYRVRLEPNNKQRSQLFQAAGLARYAYNWAVAFQNENYVQGNKFVGDIDPRKVFTKFKNKDENRWMYQSPVDVHKQAIKDACGAFKKFFQKKAKHPRFKSRKKSRPSFYQDTHKLKVSENKVYLSIIGWVRLSEKNRIPLGAKYVDPRVSFDGLHWYFSCGIEMGEQPSNGPFEDRSIGIDLGINSLAVLSNGIVIPNINKSLRVWKIKKRLKRLQRKSARSYLLNEKKTKNNIKTELSIKKLHKRISSINENHIHQFTSALVKTKPKAIVIEDLNIIGMMRNKYLSRAIGEQGFYKIRQLLTYKCEWNKIPLIIANRFFPSSKICSCCRMKKTNLKLSDRIFHCEFCGNIEDRDLNAARNLASLVNTASLAGI